MTFSIRSLMAVVLVPLLAAPVSAEPSASNGRVIVAGDKVRLRAVGLDGKRLEAEVVNMDDTSLLLRSGKGREVRIPWDSIAPSSLEVANGRRGHAGNGAVVGGLVMLLPAAYLGAMSDFQCDSSCGQGAPVFALTALIGAGVGALFGAAVRTDRWQRVETPHRRLSFGIAPVPRGGQASLSVRF